MSQDTKVFKMFRLVQLLSGGYPKTLQECIGFLEISHSSFYTYRNELLDIGFDVKQKDGKYWIDYKENTFDIFRKLMHFDEEDAYLLAIGIDKLEGNPVRIERLKDKLISFLNHQKAAEAYIKKEKPEIVHVIFNAIRDKKQIMLVNYSSGNSKTIKNRIVEPFEFKNDFSLLWAFDTEIKKNRQFKISRIETVEELPFEQEFLRLHKSQPVDVFRNTGSLDKRVEIKLDLMAKNLLIEEYPLTEKHIISLSKTTFMFSAPIAKYEGPARFVLGVFDHVEILQDNGFKEFLSQKLKKITDFFKTPDFLE
jgi:predicted DNA-binding transcriptional regulator YafY